MINESGSVGPGRWLPQARGNFQAKPAGTGAGPGEAAPVVHQAEPMPAGQSYVLPRTSWQSPEAQMKEILRAQELLDGGGRNWRVRNHPPQDHSLEWPPSKPPVSAAMYSAPVRPGEPNDSWPPTAPPPNAAMYSAPVRPGPGGIGGGGGEWPPSSPPPNAAMYSAPVRPGPGDPNDGPTWPPAPPPNAAMYSAPVRPGEPHVIKPPISAAMYGNPWAAQHNTIQGG